MNERQVGNSEYAAIGNYSLYDKGTDSQTLSIKNRDSLISNGISVVSSFSFQTQTKDNSAIISSIGENILRVNLRLNYLSSLLYDWDGEGGLPISLRVISNIKNVLSISTDVDWENWMIGPDTNATLVLYSKKTKASISMGSDEYSFYMKRDGERYAKSHIVFSPQAFLQTMHELSDYGEAN